MTRTPPLRRPRPYDAGLPLVWAAVGLECWAVNAQFEGTLRKGEC